jgi:LemA protein
MTFHVLDLRSRFLYLTRDFLPTLHKVSTMIPFVAFVALVILTAIWFMVSYNGFIRERNLIREAWSGIETQLKRRYDLIPRLVETVKGYMQHERGLLEQVSGLRAKCMTAGSIQQKGEAENALTTSLRSIFAVAEAYPDLKANQTMIELQEKLADVEDQLQLARRYYNGTVRNFNIRVESFPSNMIAGMFNFRPAEFFQIGNAAEREAPVVKF